MRKLNEQEKTAARQLLADLVAIDSAVTSTEQANRDRTEERIASFVAERVQKMGMVVQRQELAPGRPNLIAHWPDQTGRRSLMLEAHMDTVTVEGMTIDPFAARVRDGRMWGRGTCDTKASLAAFVTALDLARQAGRLPADKLYFVAAASEETGCDGAISLMRSGFRTDAAIVGEPTRCQLVTAHKGPLWMTVEAVGRACHASMPQHGVNAIEVMARVVEFAHGPWQKYLRASEHPLLGRSTCSVTTIAGGSKINIVPAHCRAEIDTRLIPGRPAEQWLADFQHMLTEYLSHQGPSEFVRGPQESATSCLGPGRRGDSASSAQTVEPRVTIACTGTHPPLDTPSDAPLVRRLLELTGRAAGQAAPLGVNYFADTGPFSAAGVTSVLLGPGDIAQAHTADEYIELDQLYLATEIILTLLTEHAGRSIISDD